MQKKQIREALLVLVLSKSATRVTIDFSSEEHTTAILVPEQNGTFQGRFSCGCSSETAGLNI